MPWPSRSGRPLENAAGGAVHPPIPVDSGPKFVASKFARVILSTEEHEEHPRFWCNKIYSQRDILKRFQDVSSVFTSLFPGLLGFPYFTTWPSKRPRKEQRRLDPGAYDFLTQDPAPVKPLTIKETHVVPKQCHFHHPFGHGLYHLYRILVMTGWCKWHRFDHIVMNHP